MSDIHWQDVNPDPNDEVLAELFRRYLVAAHAVQTGVAYSMHKDPTPSTPKHLRTGIDLSKVEHAALVKLLIAKGIITDREYYQVLAEGAEAEKAAYEQRLKELYGGSANITLG